MANHVTALRQRARAVRAGQLPACGDRNTAENLVCGLEAGHAESGEKHKAFDKFVKPLSSWHSRRPRTSDEIADAILEHLGGPVALEDPAA